MASVYDLFEFSRVNFRNGKEIKTNAAANSALI